ncbi:MAG TPA: MrpF/PhaF family protein [Actinomycetota bacterium]|nr:MrpF/PhaF family protein [Actinomycetota bacterium]
MNLSQWLVASVALLAGLVPCAVVCLRGDACSRLVGLEMGATVDTLVLLLLAEAYGRVIYFDLAVALALLSFAGGMVFAVDQAAPPSPPSAGCSRPRRSSSPGATSRPSGPSSTRSCSSSLPAWWGSA